MLIRGFLPFVAYLKSISVGLSSQLLKHVCVKTKMDAKTLELERWWMC